MEKRAAGLRSARQALGCTYSMPASTIQHMFLDHTVLSKAAVPGSEPCLTKMRTAFEPHGMDSQDKWSLFRAPTSPGSTVVPALPKPRHCTGLFSPLRAGALFQDLCYL